MEAALEIISWACIIIGSLTCLIGGFGLLKLSDVFARMHGASLIDTLGVGLILVGLMFQAGFTLVLAKLIMILLFILFTSPTATHALARAALGDHVEPDTVDGSGAHAIESPVAAGSDEEAEPSKP